MVRLLEALHPGGDRGPATPSDGTVPGDSFVLLRLLHDGQGVPEEFLDNGLKVILPAGVTVRYPTVKFFQESSQESEPVSPGLGFHLGAQGDHEPEGGAAAGG